jgi:hypothetical protein
MKTILFFFVISALISRASVAADIDDDIDDSSIAEYHEMGKIKKNVNFIILNSTSKVSSVKNKNSSDAASIANGVIIGAGSKVQGDIIIINKSEGDTTAVSKK